MKYFILILLASVFFRVLQVNALPSGLYWDELDTGYQAYSLLKTGADYFGNLFPAHLQAFADYRSGLYMYLSVPFVKVFGLNVFSVRITAILCSLLTLPVVYYLSRRVFRLSPLVSSFTVAVFAFAPWLMVQGGIAAESSLVPLFLLVGLSGFYKFLHHKSHLWMTSVFWALLLWVYGTVKLFLPLFILGIAVIYWNDLKKSLNRKYFLLPILLFTLISTPVISEIFTKKVSMRFQELSVFTDPTTSTQVDYLRLESALSQGRSREVGMQPSLLDKIIYNKYTYWGQHLLHNYFQSLSTEFLFSVGDPQLRHHINAPNIGQFYPPEIVAFVFGIAMLLLGIKRPHYRLLAFWLLAAPIPAIITRDGGNHAPRLIFLFPALVFVIALGLKHILTHRVLRAVYLCTYSLALGFSMFYFFTTYRTASAVSFNAGFIESLSYVKDQQAYYDRIILDGYNESFLMAYLFVFQPDPSRFQKSFPLPSETIAQGVEGYKFGNIHILYPGTRDWSKIPLSGKNLIVTTASQINAENQNPEYRLNRPDGNPLIFIFPRY